MNMPLNTSANISKTLGEPVDNFLTRRLSSFK